MDMFKDLRRPEWPIVLRCVFPGSVEHGLTERTRDVPWPFKLDDPQDATRSFVEGLFKRHNESGVCSSITVHDRGTGAVLDRYDGQWQSATFLAEHERRHREAAAAFDNLYGDYDQGSPLVRAYLGENYTPPRERWQARYALAVQRDPIDWGTVADVIGQPAAEAFKEHQDYYSSRHVPLTEQRTLARNAIPTSVTWEHLVEPGSALASEIEGTLPEVDPIRGGLLT